MRVKTPLVVEFEVAAPPARAFALWTEQAARWWPTDHTISNVRDVEVVFEPGVGGRVFERSPDGSEHTWGKVIAWDPPRRVTYVWHLFVDERDATEVDVSFAATTGGTLVRLEHRGWERLGDAAADRRERTGQAWSGILELFAGHAEAAA